jgi:hypothetical protein
VPPSQIFLLRHAEKPLKNPPPPPPPTPQGVDVDGTADIHSLIVQGWQRAGALVGFFCAPHAPPIRCPTYLYAPPPEGKDAAGGRPYQTISPLAAKLDITINVRFSVGDENDLVADVLTREDSIVLIAWEHDHIPLIANALLGNDTTAPQNWPSERFDVVFAFAPAPGGGWVFSQVPELLLAGDSSSIIV